MAWYKDWFDSPFYDILYKKRDDYEANKLLKVISPFLPKSPSSIADIACGRGRHSINLANQGYQVWGYDLSKRAISIAKQKARDEHLHIHFEIHDMLIPLSARFDSVVNLFTSFGYFADKSQNAKVFFNMADAVKPGGNLIIDFLNPTFVRKNLVAEKEYSTVGEYEICLCRTIEDNRVEKKIEISSETKGEIHSFVEKVSLLELDWFQAMANHNNLVFKEVLGDYTGKEFVQNDSPRQIMIFTHK